MKWENFLEEYNVQYHIISEWQSSEDDKPSKNYNDGDEENNYKSEKITQNYNLQYSDMGLDSVVGKKNLDNLLNLVKKSINPKEAKQSIINSMEILKKEVASLPNPPGNKIIKLCALYKLINEVKQILVFSFGDEEKIRKQLFGNSRYDNLGVEPNIFKMEPYKNYAQLFEHLLKRPFMLGLVEARKYVGFLMSFDGFDNLWFKSGDPIDLSNLQLLRMVMYYSKFKHINPTFVWFIKNIGLGEAYFTTEKINDLSDEDKVFCIIEGNDKTKKLFLEYFNKDYLYVAEKNPKSIRLISKIFPEDIKLKKIIDKIKNEIETSKFPEKHERHMHSYENIKIILNELNYYSNTSRNIKDILFLLMKGPEHNFTSSKITREEATRMFLEIINKRYDDLKFLNQYILFGLVRFLKEQKNKLGENEFYSKYRGLDYLIDDFDSKNKKANIIYLIKKYSKC